VDKVGTLWWTFQTWRASKWLPLTVEGVDYLGETIGEPCVIVAFNHTSSLDWYVAAEALRDAGCDNIYFVGDKSWARNPLAMTLNVIPVTSPKGFTLQDLGIIEERVRHHAENMEPVTFIAFPEGTMSATGSLQRFKIGTAYLASKLGCQVHTPSLVPLNVLSSSSTSSSGSSSMHAHHTWPAAGRQAHCR
jgi:1-acyl-sn-glycerol-3-phosphate acyltransferase